MVPEVDNKTKSVVFATKLVGKVKVSAFEIELILINIIKVDVDTSPILLSSSLKFALYQLSADFKALLCLKISK